MLRVMAAASAPLLIKVGSGRVRRGASFSPTGTPVALGSRDGANEIVARVDCVGRATLLENTCEDLDVGGKGETGDAVELGRNEVTAVVEVEVEVGLDGLVTCGGGATAPMPCDVGVKVKAAEDDNVVALDEARADVPEDIWLDDGLDVRLDKVVVG